MPLAYALHYNCYVEKASPKVKLGVTLLLLTFVFNCRKDQNDNIVSVTEEPSQNTPTGDEGNKAGNKITLAAPVTPKQNPAAINLNLYGQNTKLLGFGEELDTTVSLTPKQESAILKITLEFDMSQDEHDNWLENYDARFRIFTHDSQTESVDGLTHSSIRKGTDVPNGNLVGEDGEANLILTAVTGENSDVEFTLSSGSSSSLLTVDKLDDYGWLEYFPSGITLKSSVRSDTNLFPKYLFKRPIALPSPHYIVPLDYMPYGKDESPMPLNSPIRISKSKPGKIGKLWVRKTDPIHAGVSTAARFGCVPVIKNQYLWGAIDVQTGIVNTEKLKDKDLLSKLELGEISDAKVECIYASLSGDGIYPLGEGEKEKIPLFFWASTSSLLKSVIVED